MYNQRAPKKKMRDTPAKFKLGQEVELIKAVGTMYKVHAIHVTREGTSFSIEHKGSILDGHVKSEELQLYLPRADFYLWIDRNGNLDDCMRDANGYTILGEGVRDIGTYTCIKATKTELARIRPPEKDDTEEEFYDDDLD